MQRFWLILGAFGVADLLLAAALAFWMPSSSAPERPLLISPHLPPVITISADPRRLENRIRGIVRREFQQLAAPGGTSGPLTSVGTISQTERTRVPSLQDRVETPERQRPSARRGPETTAILTPFGMYRPGPTGVGLAILSLCTLLSAGAMVVYFLPGRLRVVRDALSVPWYRALHLGAVGLLGYLLGLLLMLILITLVIGLPFALVLLLVLAICTLLGFVAVSLALGRWLKSRLALSVASPLADFSLGALALFPLSLIPLLGWVLVFLVVSLGFGAILVTKFGSQGGWSLDPLLEEGDGAHFS